MPSWTDVDPTTRVVVGVDVSVRRGLDVVVLDAAARVVDARSRLEARDLGDLLARWRPVSVAIDSPPGPGREPGATSRRCERELRALGVNIFLTPSDPERFAGPFYDWVRVGSRGFEVAAAVGYPLHGDSGVVRGCAFEVFPHASDVFLRGCLRPVHTTRRVGTKRAWRLATLEAAGVNTSDLCVNRVGAQTLDSIDAALAAVTALRAVDGVFSVFGSAGEWIVVPETTPAALVRHSPTTGRTVGRAHVVPHVLEVTTTGGRLPQNAGSVALPVRVPPHGQVAHHGRYVLAQAWLDTSRSLCTRLILAFLDGMRLSRPATLTWGLALSRGVSKEGGMKGTSAGRAFAGLAFVAGLIAGTGSAALAAPTTFQYTFTNQNQNDSFIDVGLCDPGPAAVMLIGFNEALHVSATESGLTEAEIWALLEDDPNGVIVRVTYTQTGRFIVEEASGVTYTGRFTSWFGGNVNSHTAVFSGTFSVRGTGDDGSRVTGNFTSHVTFVGGEPVVEFDKGHMRGCAA